MAKRVEILFENLREHPAVQAWSNIEAIQVEPRMIAVIKRWKARKGGVYRLAGVGPDGSAVIAKRCPKQTAMIERPIYEEFLPRIGLQTLRYYGSVNDPDGESEWLFLEEAGGDFYSPFSSDHRALAARWLAAIHGAGGSWKGRLPDRSAVYYLELLQSVRAKASEYATCKSMRMQEVNVLQKVTRQCDVLEEHWNKFEEVCRFAPTTVVHGDFVEKNARVRSSASGPELMVFDWEFAGYGVPAIDLAQFCIHSISPDLSAYGCWLECWPAKKAEIGQLAACGRFFRLINALWWESFSLKSQVREILDGPVHLFEVYSREIDQALKATGWTNDD